MRRSEEDFVIRRVLNMEVKGKRVRGRPKRRWMECTKEDHLEKN
jgi:tRNA U34 5-methylaminomethyl-2-thiouridine-forming methyltransferase MnmC